MPMVREVIFMFLPVGYYKISLNTKENTLSIVATDEPKNVYDGLLISGDFNGWGY